MEEEMQQAREFLRSARDWDDGDCREAFGVLEGLVDTFECLDARDFYRMYHRRTKVFVDSVDLADLARRLSPYDSRHAIDAELSQLNIPSDDDTRRVVSDRLEKVVREDESLHADFEEAFAELDAKVSAERRDLMRDFISTQFQQEDWVLELVAELANRGEEGR